MLPSSVLCRHLRPYRWVLHVQALNSISHMIVFAVLWSQDLRYDRDNHDIFWRTRFGGSWCFICTKFPSGRYFVALRDQIAFLHLSKFGSVDSDDTNNIFSRVQRVKLMQKKKPVYQDIWKLKSIQVYIGRPRAANCSIRLIVSWSSIVTSFINK